MACELMACCQFFDDKMKNLPTAAEYIKNRRCLDDYESCSRFRIYQKYGGESLPPYLDPDDTEEVEKALECLRKKRG